MKYIHIDPYDVLNVWFTQELEEPFYICDLGDLIYKHEQWLTHMPRIKPFYGTEKIAYWDLRYLFVSKVFQKSNKFC